MGCFEGLCRGKHCPTSAGCFLPDLAAGKHKAQPGCPAPPASRMLHFRAAKEPAGCDAKRRAPRMGLSGILLPHSLLAVRKKEQEAPGFFTYWGWRHLPSSVLCRTPEQRRSSACPDALTTLIRCSPREYLHSRRKGMQPWQFPAPANVTSLGKQTAARRPGPPCPL